MVDLSVRSKEVSMLPAQVAALGVASATHDQMMTDDMKKRARETSAEEIDIDSSHRSYIPAVGQPYPVAPVKGSAASTRALGELCRLLRADLPPSTPCHVGGRGV